MYVAVDVETHLLLVIELFSRRGTDPTAAILYRPTEQHNLSVAVLLVVGYGYLTALSRLT